MIYIVKGETNKICLTLSETATLPNPFFLFVFTREVETETEPIYWQPEQAEGNARFNLFNMIETELDLAPGQYRYDVYESETATEDISQTTGTAIESGRMVVQLKNQITSIYD